jgi:hypothetical protein
MCEAKTMALVSRRCARVDLVPLSKKQACGRTVAPERERERLRGGDRLVPCCLPAPPRPHASPRVAATGKKVAGRGRWFYMGGVVVYGMVQTEGEGERKERCGERTKVLGGNDVQHSRACALPMANIMWCGRGERKPCVVNDGRGERGHIRPPVSCAPEEKKGELEAGLHHVD